MERRTPSSAKEEPQSSPVEKARQRRGRAALQGPHKSLSFLNGALAPALPSQPLAYTRYTVERLRRQTSPRVHSIVHCLLECHVVRSDLPHRSLQRLEGPRPKISPHLTVLRTHLALPKRPHVLVFPLQQYPDDWRGLHRTHALGLPSYAPRPPILAHSLDGGNSCKEINVLVYPPRGAALGSRRTSPVFHQRRLGRPNSVSRRRKLAS